MDEIDRYSHLESEMVEKNIRRMRESLVTHNQLGAEVCEDCDASIPMARRKAVPTATRCVTCQEEYEA